MNCIMEINWIQLEINIDKNLCPANYYCVQATTYYEQHEAERMCLRCWQDHYKERGYEIDYSFDGDLWKEHLELENKNFKGENKVC